MKGPTTGTQNIKNLSKGIASSNLVNCVDLSQLEESTLLFFFFRS